MSLTQLFSMSSDSDLFVCGKWLKTGSESELKIRSVLHVLKSLFYPLTLCCGYSKELSQWDDSFEYLQHRVWLDNKRDITGERAANPSLSGPLRMWWKVNNEIDVDRNKTYLNYLNEHIIKLFKQRITYII